MSRWTATTCARSSSADFRSHLGYVPQEAFLFTGTVRDNIAYGRPAASDAEVEAAARAVGAHDVVAGMTNGYLTELGERGGSLSSGQRQLIALARAQLADPTLLLLDEATSNLDLATESRVNAAMREVARGRTTILIAHRLQTDAVRRPHPRHGRRPGGRERHARRAARARRRLRAHVAGVRDRGRVSAVASDLTDSELIGGPRLGSMRTWVRQASDRLAGADPGLTQARTATQAVLGVLVSVGLIYGFVRITGASQLPAGSGPAAVVSATNHALLIVSMLVGGILAMMAGFTVNDPSPVQQLVSTLLLPIPMVASVALGLALGPYRIPSLVFLVVVMTAAVYVRRFGPRGFAAGLVAFQGAFLGFFLHTELHFSDIWWLAADLGLGIVASLLVRFGLLRTDPEQTLERMRRSWQARAFRLLQLGADAVRGPSARHRRRALDRPVAPRQPRRAAAPAGRAAQRIDVDRRGAAGPHLAHVGRGWRPSKLFSAELSLTNCARFSAALSRVLLGSDADARDEAALALLAARDEDWPRCHELAARLRERRASTPRAVTLLRRLALSIEQYATARERLRAAIDERRRGADRGHLRTGRGAQQRPPAGLGAGQRTGLDHPGRVAGSSASRCRPTCGRRSRSRWRRPSPSCSATR